MGKLATDETRINTEKESVKIRVSSFATAQWLAKKVANFLIFLKSELHYYHHELLL
jgi:hypothetical protein